MEKVKTFLNKIMSFLKKNIKMVVLALVVAIVVIAFIIVGVSVSKGKSKTNEEELNTLLKEMGKDFYETYLYDSLTENDKQSFLERISVTGLKLDLDNLGRYDSKKNVDNLKKFVNSKTGEACNATKTFVTIYPNAPYSKTDYTVETTIDCGFEEK